MGKKKGNGNSASFGTNENEDSDFQMIFSENDPPNFDIYHALVMV